MAAFVYPVHRACETAVALRRADFGVQFRDGHVELFKHVVERLIRYLVPLDRRGLLFGHDVFHIGIDFGQHIACSD